MVFLLVLAGVGSVRAQQLPSSEELRNRIHAYAEQYRQNLPSFEVDESAVSQQVKGDRVKWEVKLEMGLREIRDEAHPGDLKDFYTFRLVNGKPPKKHLKLPPFNRKAKLPYFVHGVFSNVIGFVGTGMGCMEYRVSPGTSSATVKLETWNKQGPLPEECKDILEDYHKTLLVERETGRVLHVTRSMSDEAARTHHELAFVDVEFAPQKLGEETFWLPVHFVTHGGKNEGRMEATYSNFHRYTASVKILESDPLPEVTP